MSEPIRILIVEDEFITMDALRDALTGMGYGVSGDAMRADEALSILDEGQTDLAILDIHIKGARSGIWLAEQIRERYHIPFIFLTAFGDKQTIADAARTQPGSYLVKPFVEQDLHAAIELALHTYQAVPSTALEPALPAIEVQDEQPNRLLVNDSIFVKDDLIYRRISVSEIQFIQSFRNYVEVNVGQGKKYLLRSTLKDFLAQLPPTGFIQTHRSYAVNISLVNRIGGNFVGVGDSEVPLSKEVRNEVIKRLNTYQ
jgi:DNA-binding LytR/AlgR family response regulator